MSQAAYETLIVERDGAVEIIRLNRPKALNALSGQLMDELTAAIDQAETDEGVRAMILTGSEKAFAAGADIKEMAAQSYAEAYKVDFITRNWERAARRRKPAIAAVAGYALGGGCELAMMCDIIFAADNAKFGQPEVNIGAIPGAGGTQRLTRLIGKSKAMEMILTGRMMGAEEAERAGLVSRVVPLADLMPEALAVARKIAELSPLSMMLAKELVDAAYETTLSQGIAFERRLFQSTFAFEDQKEGMAAFADKRPPAFKGR